MLLLWSWILILQTSSVFQTIIFKLGWLFMSNPFHLEGNFSWTSQAAPLLPFPLSFLQEKLIIHFLHSGGLPLTSPKHKDSKTPYIAIMGKHLSQSAFPDWHQMENFSFSLHIASSWDAKPLNAVILSLQAAFSPGIPSFRDSLQLSANDE